MRLQTKLTLASAGVIAALGLAVGTVAVIANESAGVASIDKVLESGADTIINEKSDKLAAAFLVSSEAGDSLEVGYLAATGELSNLSAGGDVIAEAPTAAELTAASKSAVSVATNDAYRLRAIKLDSGDWVLLAMSLTDVTAQRTAAMLGLGGVTGLAILLGAAAIALITRRETRKIARLTSEAERIAAGDLEHDLAAEAGSSEVDRLSRALDEMVSALQQAVTVERAAQERMQEFLGDASHELRTPLTVVRGYLEMISKQELPVEQRARAHDRMAAEIQRMERLIKDLLQIAELSEATSSVALIDAVDLSEVVQTAADDLAAIQPGRSVEVRIEPGLSVLGRDDLLRQLLANLTGNIARHTSVNDRVLVRLAADGAWVQLDIEDAGPGLPEAAYGHGVDAFKRFDPARSRVNGGSGLGMSIITGIVKTLSGTIELSRSADLGGLHTSIRLPLAG
jgi:signal transduction histidine kinase